MTRTNPLQELKESNDVIERHLSSFKTRGEVAQDILGQTRHLVEHLAMALKYQNSFNGDDYYKAINPVFGELKQRKETRFLYEFHQFLQRTVSHYTPSQDESQRLLLKYREYFVLCKELATKELNISILSGLDNINWDEDPGLSQFYSLILETIKSTEISTSTFIAKERYYLYSRKSIFSKERMFYEYALVPAMNFTSKFDHVIAFSLDRIPTNYAVELTARHSKILMLGRELSILIIDDWHTSIRPCEINKLLKILGSNEMVSGQLNSYKELMSILTDSQMNLIDLCTLPDEDFDSIVARISISGKKIGIRELLQRLRPFLLSQMPGSNILRYLIFKPRHRIILEQLDLQNRKNDLLSDLCLKNGCIPFDKQPFCTALINHTPANRDLLMCIDPVQYESDLFAHAVKEREENLGKIFISEKDFSSLDNIDELIQTYNHALYCRHKNRQLLHEMNQFFFKEAEDHLILIIEKLLKLSCNGIPGYSLSAEAKLKRMNPVIDDQQKEIIATKAFEKSCVALIYGSAGTGKTTLINIICNLFAGSKKIAIANTNPAVDNLRRRIKANNCDFMTITKYLKSETSYAYDLLILDECSTVSNKNMYEILLQGNFRFLLLVGDIYQIEAIHLGNWFAIVKNFLNKYCIFQLDKSWRSADINLKSLWDSVRKIDEDITEKLSVCNVSKPLCDDIFKTISNDEIILCLNYDGLYGINSINRMLQAANPNKPVRWGLQTYKVDDPILFNESGRFFPVLYNNLKGRISKLKKIGESSLVVEAIVDRPLNAHDVTMTQGLTYVESLPDGTTKVEFIITEHYEDDNGYSSNSSIVPFQVAYAISIHKAQGLEYDSVKIIITKDVESSVTHSIFYTAITRAKNYLSIYWSPETQENVINGFEIIDIDKDIQLLSKRNGFELQH